VLSDLATVLHHRVVVRELLGCESHTSHLVALMQEYQV
jgi:hypothetical protein